MEFHQLRSLVTVSDVGSLSRAAAILNLTQSAISKHIKSVECELGIRFFERSSSGMALTPQGRDLLQLASHTLLSMDRLAIRAASLAGEVQGTLRIGTIVDLESIHLRQLLSEIRSRYPAIDIRLEHGMSGSVLSRVNAGALDAGFFLGQVSEAGVDHMLLSDQYYVVAAAASWQSKFQYANWSDLTVLPWVRTSNESSQTRLLRDIEKIHGAVARTTIEVDHESLLIEVIGSGAGLGLIRERHLQMVRPDHGLAVWGGERIKSPLSLIWRQSETKGAAVTALLECVRAVWPVQS
jgi:DNA-binding transcriptional LysR family regulator